MPLLVKKKVSSEGGIKKPTVPRNVWINILVFVFYYTIIGLFCDNFYDLVIKLYFGKVGILVGELAENAELYL